MITVSSGTGYWKYNALELRKTPPLFWYLIMPLSTHLFGYFPGKKMGMIGDLLKRVMYQWRRCCLHPDYRVGVESETVKTNFQQIDVPLVSITFSDDGIWLLTNLRELD